jgi:glycosyltransferase involved in cell wall biosynthesis
MPIPRRSVSISVVIPTFNRAPLLAQALASLPSDRDLEVEIIVVDDGSTDGTETIAGRFGREIQFIRQERLGPGSARNLGWSVASGDYIAFLDSDDLWLPWTLETYLEVLDRFEFPSFVVGTGAWFKHESELQNVSREPTQLRSFPDYLASAELPIWLGASSMLVQRRCTSRFESTHMNAEDLDFALHMGQEAGFVWIQKPFTFGYRRHDATAVMSLEKTLIGINHLVEEERADHYPGGPGRRIERIQMITRAVRPPVIEALRQEKSKDAFALYKRTFRWHLLLRRFRFLLAVPLLAFLFALRKTKR